MPLTNAQKVTIRTYLGWPTYASWDTTLESVMDVVGADVDAAALVAQVLANLASVEAEIADLHALALAGKVEESDLNPRRYQDLRSAGRREVVRLAALMNLDGPRRDVFAPGSSGGELRWG